MTALKDHDHRWSYRDHQPSQREAQQPASVTAMLMPKPVTRDCTLVLQGCECGDMRVVTLAGHWDASGLKAVRECPPALEEAARRAVSLLGSAQSQRAREVLLAALEGRLCPVRSAST